MANVSDTSALIVFKVTEGSWTWAQSPCRKVPANGEYQLLGLAPGTTYKVSYFSDADCGKLAEFVSFETEER